MKPMQPKNPFMDPAEKALQAAMSKRDDGIDVSAAKGGYFDSVMTGTIDEIESLAMNDTLTDIETAFDGIYLAFPRHTQMQLQIDRVRLHGLKAEGRPMRGLRILGPTGSGKTTGIEEYAAHLNRKIDQEDGQDRGKQRRKVPLVYVRLRKKANWTKVLRAILNKFGDRHASRRDVDELNEQVRNCIHRAGVEVIVIDECQHLKNLTTDSMIVTDELKVFLDDSIVPVVFAGTYDAKPMFAANPELCGRLGPPVDLAPLSADSIDDMDLFVEFILRLDSAMVELKLTIEPSGLDKPQIIACLHETSGGVIGQAYRIIRAALLIATSREASHVEAYDLMLAVDRWAIPNGICRSNPFRLRWTSTPCSTA